MILCESYKYSIDKIIQRAVETLKKGGVIIYPTDTVYGIGCDLFSKSAIEKIYWVKQEKRRKPLTFICESLKHVSQFAHVSNSSYKFMKRIIPGPYTFILEATSLVPKIVMTKQKTVGIRVPSNPVSLGLVRELGNPIINTSVKMDIEDNVQDPYEIEERYSKLVDLIIDGGIVPVQYSTIIDLTTSTPEIIRMGKGEI